MIDDLDRCSPETIVSLLESMKLFTEVPGFIFVLAVDYQVLISAIEDRYPHVNAVQFLEKIIQVPFRVPQPNFSDQNVMNELIENWDSEIKKTWFPDINDDIYSAIAFALRNNPRQIKRLVNSYLILRHINWNNEALTHSVLLGALTLQISNEEVYEKFVNQFRREVRALIYERSRNEANVSPENIGTIGQLKCYQALRGQELDSAEPKIESGGTNVHSSTSIDLTEIFDKLLNESVKISELNSVIETATAVSSPSTETLDLKAESDKFKKLATPIHSSALTFLKHIKELDLPLEPEIQQNSLCFMDSARNKFLRISCSFDNPSNVAIMAYPDALKDYSDYIDNMAPDVILNSIPEVKIESNYNGKIWPDVSPESLDNDTWKNRINNLYKIQERIYSK